LVEQLHLASAQATAGDDDFVKLVDHFLDESIVDVGSHEWQLSDGRRWSCD